MAKMNCSNNTYYKDGKCCDRCSAGTYVQADCDGSKPTKCAKCEHGRYTATKNHLNKCQICSVCSSHNKQKKAYSCTATQNTVCDCETGFYCSNVQCDHCLPLTKCIEGEGVKLPAGRTNDTICAPCEKGTYSNKTDFFSTCEKHTRCEDLGRELKSEGTSTKNAVCRCSWMLPAALWSGLVLTALILFAVVICRRAKRKSYRAGMCNTSHVLVSSLSFTHFYDDEDNLVSCSVDSSLPITPFKASVSFAESNHTIRSAGYRTGSFLRTYSEPQEDEWCGT
uniref:Tumor necrosis factor receptor superfamily member 5-like n=1 Tax=Seriola lalandi dorsalis TaxID=1841481 RepID=A0A3B4Z704_SERLL